MISCDRTIDVGQEVYTFLFFFSKKEKRKKKKEKKKKETRMIPSLLAYRAMLSASSKAWLVVNLNRRRRRLVLM